MWGRIKRFIGAWGIMTYFDYIIMLDLKDTRDAFIEYLVNVLDWKKTDAIDYAVIMYK